MPINLIVHTNRFLVAALVELTLRHFFSTGTTTTVALTLLTAVQLHSLAACIQYTQMHHVQTSSLGVVEKHVGKMEKHLLREK